MNYKNTPEDIDWLINHFADLSENQQQEAITRIQLLVDLLQNLITPAEQRQAKVVDRTLDWLNKRTILSRSIHLQDYQRLNEPVDSEGIPQPLFPLPKIILLYRKFTDSGE